MGMKIGVVGCGAVGSYYGARLDQAGEEVHFLLRSDYEAVRLHGVRVKSLEGDFEAHPRCATAPAQIGPCDLVLIALKTTANDQFTRLLPDLVAEKTAVLTLQNGLGNESALARIFPAAQILGGMCFVCLNRTAPGVIRHLDHGQIVIGDFSGGPKPRTHDIAETFRRSGVPCKVSANLLKSRWEKLVWNIPFNGLGVAASAGFEALSSGKVPAGAGHPCLSTERLLANTQWTQVVRELMVEIISAANGLGFEISQTVAEIQLERTRSMGPYKPSTVIDYEQGRSIELESLFLEPLRQAKAANIPCPWLERVCAVLQELNDRQVKNCVQA
jgi:2-dehydropantoate 2-reductase